MICPLTKFLDGNGESQDARVAERFRRDLVVADCACNNVIVQVYASVLLAISGPDSGAVRGVEYLAI